MELVINANILFSMAKSESKTREIISLFPLILHSPEFALKEIKKYKKEIMSKANIQDFEEFIKLLKERINFINLEYYKSEIKKCKNLIPDEKDTEYLALSKKLKIPLWSNDKLLKNQTMINVINTPELVDLLELT